MNDELLQDPEKFTEIRRRQMLALFRLWSSLIHEHQPTEENFCGWLETFGVEVTADAIRRTAAKARKRRREHDPMDARDLERYATGTMKRMGTPPICTTVTVARCAV
jgi:hypothetical protein